MATERERYELPPALAASGAGRGRSGFEDGFEPTDSPAVPSKGRSRTCPACGEDRLLRPTATIAVCPCGYDSTAPAGRETTPCLHCGAGSIYAHALHVLIEEFEDALPYVPDYFRQKWGYDRALAEAKSVLDLAVDHASDGTP